MLVPEMLAEGSRFLEAARHSPTELAALVSVVAGAALVFVSSTVKTMIPLRWLAIGSNVGFIVYGALYPSYSTLVLQAVLLPLNVFRLAEMKRLTRRVEAAAVARETSGVWLKPYMRSARLRAGTVLFRKGDRGDRLYLLAEGRIELVEIAADIAPGAIFGEIAFFAPDRQRSFTARCATDCTVLSIDEQTVKELYYQNPSFGFKMIELVAARLSADAQRLQRELQLARGNVSAAGGAATMD